MSSSQWRRPHLCSVAVRPFDSRSPSSDYSSHNPTFPTHDTRQNGPTRSSARCLCQNSLAPPTLRSQPGSLCIPSFQQPESRVSLPWLSSKKRSRLRTATYQITSHLVLLALLTTKIPSFHRIPPRPSVIPSHLQTQTRKSSQRLGGGSTLLSWTWTSSLTNWSRQRRSTGSRSHTVFASRSSLLIRLCETWWSWHPFKSATSWTSPGHCRQNPMAANPLVMATKSLSSLTPTQVVSVVTNSTEHCTLSACHLYLTLSMTCRPCTITRMRSSPYPIPNADYIFTAHSTHLMLNGLDSFAHNTQLSQLVFLVILLLC